MANEKQYPMTKEGKEKLEQELEYLKTVKRKEVVERIKIARGLVIYRKTRNTMQQKMSRRLSNHAFKCSKR